MNKYTKEQKRILDLNADKSHIQTNSKRVRFEKKKQNKVFKPIANKPLNKQDNKTREESRFRSNFKFNKKRQF